VMNKEELKIEYFIKKFMDSYLFKSLSKNDDENN